MQDGLGGVATRQQLLVHEPHARAAGGGALQPGSAAVGVLDLDAVGAVLVTVGVSGAGQVEGDGHGQ